MLGVLPIALGCSTTPRELPTCEIPGPSLIIQAQRDLPVLPDPVRFTEKPQTATFDRSGMDDLKRYHIAAVTNKTIADKNAAALQARNGEVEALIECARYQGIWVQVHEEDLKEEKQEHFKDNLVREIIIGVMVIGGAIL